MRVTADLIETRHSHVVELCGSYAPHCCGSVSKSTAQKPPHVTIAETSNPNGRVTGGDSSAMNNDVPDQTPLVRGMLEFDRQGGFQFLRPAFGRMSAVATTLRVTS